MPAPINRRHTLTMGLMLALSHCAMGQNLPPPSRTVYRCEVDKKVVYSDAPCLGARRVDVTPTQGLDSSTGQRRIGEDVRREQHNATMAKALQPLLGETPEQYALRHRRARLAPPAIQECARMDGQLRQLEAAETAAGPGAGKDSAKKDLYAARLRHRDLGC